MVTLHVTMVTLHVTIVTLHVTIVTIHVLHGNTIGYMVTLHVTW